MKKIVFAIMLILNSVNILSADVYVHGYTKSNGTYVPSHYRSSPNSVKSDNFSTYGNVNPYTGKAGTKKYNTSSSNYGYSSKSSKHSY